MEQTFNKPFHVNTYDVAEIQKNWRIIYFPQQEEVIIAKSYDKAELIATKESFRRVGYVLTRRQAPRSFPQVFYDSENQTERELEKRTVILKVSPEQYAFIARFGNVSAYLRQLIDQQMKQDK